MLKEPDYNLFKDPSFEITNQINVHIVDFLKVQFNLGLQSFQPYQ